MIALVGLSLKKVIKTINITMVGTILTAYFISSVKAIAEPTDNQPAATIPSKEAPTGAVSTSITNEQKPPEEKQSTATPSSNLPATNQTPIATKEDKAPSPIPSSPITTATIPTSSPDPTNASSAPTISLPLPPTTPASPPQNNTEANTSPTADTSAQEEKDSSFKKIGKKVAGKLNQISTQIKSIGKATIIQASPAPNPKYSPQAVPQSTTTLQQPNKNTNLANNKLLVSNKTKNKNNSALSKANKLEAMRRQRGYYSAATDESGNINHYHYFSGNVDPVSIRYHTPYQDHYKKRSKEIIVYDYSIQNYRELEKEHYNYNELEKGNYRSPNKEPDNELEKESYCFFDADQKKVFCHKPHHPSLEGTYLDPPPYTIMSKNPYNENIVLYQQYRTVPGEKDSYVKKLRARGCNYMFENCSQAVKLKRR